MSYGRGLVVGAMSLVIFIGILQLLSIYGSSWYTVSLPRSTLPGLLSFEVSIGLRSVSKQACYESRCVREGQSLESLASVSSEWEGFEAAGHSAFVALWFSFLGLGSWFAIGLTRLLLHPLSVPKFRFHVTAAVLLSFGVTLLGLALFAANAPGFRTPQNDPYIMAGLLSRPTNPSPSPSPSPPGEASPPPPPPTPPLVFDSFEQDYGSQFSVLVACMILQTLAGMFLVVPFYQVDELDELNRAFLVLQPNGDVMAAVSPLLRSHLHIQCPECLEQMAAPAQTTVVCPSCSLPVVVPADIPLVDMFQALPPEDGDDDGLYDLFVDSSI